MEFKTSELWFRIIGFAISKSIELRSLSCTSVYLNQVMQEYVSSLGVTNNHEYLALLKNEKRERRNISIVAWNNLWYRRFRTPLHQNRYYLSKVHEIAKLKHRLVSPTLLYHSSDTVHAMSSYIVSDCLATRNYNPLREACWQFGGPWLPTIQALIRHGHPVNQVNPLTGETLLFKTHQPKVINFLLDHGVPIDHQDFNGYTALRHHIYSRSLSAVKTMLHRGCHVSDESFRCVPTIAIFRALYNHRKYSELEQQSIVVHAIHNAIDPRKWMDVMKIDPLQFRLPNNESMLHHVLSIKSLRNLLRVAPCLRQTVNYRDTLHGFTPLHRLVHRVLKIEPCSYIVGPESGLQMARLLRSIGALTTVADTLGTIPFETWIKRFRWGQWKKLGYRKKRAWFRILSRGGAVARRSILHSAADSYQTIVMLINLGADPGRRDIVINKNGQREHRSLLSVVYDPNVCMRLLQRYPDAFESHLHDPSTMRWIKNKECGKILILNGAQVDRDTFFTALKDPYRWWLVEATLDRFPETTDHVVQGICHAYDTYRESRDMKSLLAACPRMKKLFET